MQELKMLAPQSAVSALMSEALPLSGMGQDTTSLNKVS